MKFGVFYELATPRPWDEMSEKRIIDEAIEQIELADRLGISTVWMTEHHFMEEYCHATAPEVFLAAVAARTKNIRIAHGVRHSPPKYNHPARVAEMASTLDLISNGRLELGTGDSGSQIEMGAFGVDSTLKREMALEAVEQIANMMAMDPFPGFKGKHFSMPARNVIPKPMQKPHPPFWLACSARPTIETAGEKGMGVVCFSFLEAAEAKMWVDDYYDLIKNQCVPLTHTVNPNFALFTGFGVHQDEQVALDRFMDGIRFFQFSAAHYYRGGAHKPGRVDLWQRFQEEKAELIKNENDEFVNRQIATSRGSIGSVEQIRNRFRDLEAAGVDQIVFIMQHGKTKHEHIMESLELFAKEIMPEFAERHEERERKKAEELAPYIEKAFERRGGRPITRPADEDIEDVNAVNYIFRYGKEEAVFGSRIGSKAVAEKVAEQIEAVVKDQDYP